MTQSLYLVYAPNHVLHRPQAYFVAGKMTAHPDVPERVEVILSALASLDGVVVEASHRRATDQELCAVHTPAYVAFLDDVYEAWASAYPDVPEVVPDTFALQRPGGVPGWLPARAGRHGIDTATPIGAHTVEAARTSAGCALAAAEALLAGRCSLAYALCRPPGHHAGRALYGGFCYLNNAALAAERLSRLGRVAVLDLDYHHGNGTQDIFYRTDEVLLISIHADPNHDFPFHCGYADEGGEGAGKGFNVNYPIDRDTDPASYMSYLEKALDLVGAKACTHLVVSMGYDTAQGDPLGGFRLQPDDYPGIGRAVASLGLPTLIVQEGGYAIDRLGSCARGFVEGLLL
jgi:acetoin utilization deacetylase AcuC-like enzyme